MADSEKPSEVAEKALRALWMFDVTVFESCRCACCGGLRQVDRQETSGRIQSRKIVNGRSDEGWL